MTAITTSQYSARFTLKNANGTPYVLTGKTLEMRIGVGNGSTNILPINSTNGRLVITDAVNGIVDLILSQTDMLNFPARTYQFEIGQTNTALGYSYLFGGYFKVRQGVPQ